MAESVNNSSSDGGVNPTDDKKDVKNQGIRTFTQEELGAKISEERKRWKEQTDEYLRQALTSERERWEREAKMTEEQKLEEAQKAQKEALDKREREITLRERKAEALETLASKNIPTAFAPYVIDEDETKMSENIKTLGKVWSEELNKAVKDAAKGNTPTDKTENGGTGKTTATPSNVFKGNGVMAF